MLKNYRYQAQTHTLPQGRPGLKTNDKIVPQNETARNSTIHHKHKPAGRSKIHTAAGEATEDDPLAKTEEKMPLLTKMKVRIKPMI